MAGTVEPNGRRDGTIPLDATLNESRDHAHMVSTKMFVRQIPLNLQLTVSSSVNCRWLTVAVDEIPEVLSTLCSTVKNQLHTGSSYHASSSVAMFSPE